MDIPSRMARPAAVTDKAFSNQLFLSVVLCRQRLVSAFSMILSTVELTNSTDPMYIGRSVKSNSYRIACSVVVRITSI